MRLITGSRVVIVKHRVASSGWLYPYCSYTICSHVLYVPHAHQTCSFCTNLGRKHRTNSEDRTLVSELEAQFVLTPPSSTNPSVRRVTHLPFCPSLRCNAWTFVCSELRSKCNTEHCSGARKVSSGKATWYRDFWYVRTKVMSYAIFRSI